MTFNPNLPKDRSDFSFLGSITGLSPRLWLCVGAGYSREDFKSLILSQGRGFVADAVTTPQELCLKILGVPQDRVLSSAARQEVLRFFLAEKRVMAGLVEMKKIRRQKNWVKSLDLAIQSGRLASAHLQEEEVYQDRLKQVLGDQPLRQELRAFAQAYEVWMETLEWWDLPLLLKCATQRLREGGWPEGVARPEMILLASVPVAESLERDFWDVIGTQVQVAPFEGSVSSEMEGGQSSASWDWQRWHTLDDAAEFLADHLLQELASIGDAAFDRNAILIPDHPGVRRTLRRALETRAIPLAEPRDPTQLRGDEALKVALLPLQVVARNFERSKVISWTRSWVRETPDPVPNWVSEIHARGIRAGIRWYSGGVLEDLYPRLEHLQTSLGGRKTAREVGDSHLTLMKNQKETVSELELCIPLLEAHWQSLFEDLDRTGQAERKAPLLYWLERIENRLAEASPPVEALKPRRGVRLYRLQQAPVLAAEQVWLLGVPPRWFSGEGVGDLWYSQRDREILAAEFALRSRFQIREERLTVLRRWIKGAKKVMLLESEFDSGGREQESLRPWVKELEKISHLALPDTPQLRGAHPRTLASYSSIRRSQPTQVELAPLVPSIPGQKVELSATLVDRQSRCGFQALAFHRWKLRDVREPTTELWPDVRGTILHEAVRVLMSSRNPSGHFAVGAEEALDRAWFRHRPQGLIRSTRVENYVRSRLVRVLAVFLEKEKAYFLKARTQVLSLDDRTLRLDYSGFVIRGKPDRIDQCDQGLFIMDYKTAGTVPHGQEMLESSYRLQLPFYAVAAARQFGQDVLGVQFIELDSKGGRKSGILFEEFNGKEPGKLTQLRSNSKSLFSNPRHEVWSRMEHDLIQAAESYLSGRFEARPRVHPPLKECTSCRVGDLCGLRRRTDSE